MVKESWDLGIPLFSNQRARMAGPGLLGFKIKKNGRKIFRPLPVYSGLYISIENDPNSLRCRD